MIVVRLSEGVGNVLQSHRIQHQNNAKTVARHRPKPTGRGKQHDGEIEWEKLKNDKHFLMGD